MAVTLKRNTDQQGIELIFDKKPEREILTLLKEQGFRWHNKNKLWFATETPERLAFAEDLTGTAISAVAAAPSNADTKKGRASPKPMHPNTFAASYDSIGDTKILESSDISLQKYTGAYFKDIECSFGRTYSGDSIFMTELCNAGKRGKICKGWSLHSLQYGENVSNLLSEEENIKSCKELYEALKAGREFENLRIYENDQKSMDVFSPFEEVTPLKELPEKWTKRNFRQAVMSGQIFRGEVKYRYTDDYAYDAAYNFGEGASLYMPSFAKKAVEDWSSLTWVRQEGAASDGIVLLSYSEHSNSGKTLWFDINCDIKEGKRRADDRAAGLIRFNKMMEDSCISLRSEDIRPDRVYRVQTLDKNCNSGKYGTKEENLPGHVLQYRLDEGYMLPTLSIKPLEIQRDKIYEISNFHNRPSSDLTTDDRVIDCGNWKSIVLGNALQELVSEGVHLPIITDPQGEYETPAKAESTLLGFVSGKSRFFVQNAANYEESLSRLQKEIARATSTKKPTLDAMIQSAASRTEQREQEPSNMAHSLLH